MHNYGGADADSAQVRNRIRDHVLPRHGSGTPAHGTKFADGLGEDELLVRYLARQWAGVKSETS